MPIIQMKTGGISHLEISLFMMQMTLKGASNNIMISAMAYPVLLS